jgi:hypothetical protein
VKCEEEERIEALCRNSAKRRMGKRIMYFTMKKKEIKAI